MSPTRPRFVLPLALGIAIAAVSTASILIRFAQTETPSLAIAAARLTIATLILAPVALIRHRHELTALSRREFGLAALSGLFLAVHFATWISSLEYTTVASSVVLVSTGPLWVAVFAPAFLGERITRAAIAGLALAILGGLVIGATGTCNVSGGIHCGGLSEILHGPALWGNFLALAGAWAVSGYLIVGRRLRPSVALVPYVFLAYGFAAAALLVTMVARGQTLAGLHPLTYLWLLLLAIVPQLIGHSTYNWALRFLPAAVVAVATLGEPIGSSILAYFVLKEMPGPGVLIGGALILCGIYLAARAVPRESVMAE